MAEVRPGDYACKITADALVRVFLIAYAWRMSGLREIADRLGAMLGTDKFGSLSPALARPSSLSFVQRLVQGLQTRHTPGREEFVALDSMALALPATQRHRCAKMNNKTAGGGVLWAFMIGAAQGCCPVQVLKVMAGAWNDSRQMAGIKLIADGPVYLMDRGFFSLPLVASWLGQGVRFILRAKMLVGIEPIRQLSRPRPYRGGRITSDQLVRLGAKRAKAHPEVRLIEARIGKTFLRIVTSEMDWSAERVLDGYKKRERIERFHRFLKETIGLSHLYSFAHEGIMFLLHTALLLALLLIIDNPRPRAMETVDAMRQALRSLRAAFGMTYIWKRNTLPASRDKDSAPANP